MTVSSKALSVEHLLHTAGIPATPQRLAVAQYVLATEDHPSAEKVWGKVRLAHAKPLSRATVYNTLNLFVAKGLLRALVLAEGKVVFDPNIHRHHHFIDEATGEIRDVPWNAVEVRHVEALPHLEVTDYQVVMKGRTRR